MNQNISIISLVIHSSLIVQIIIVMLLLFSIFSWGIIINKWVKLIHIKYNIYNFQKEFTNNDNIIDLFNKINKQKNKSATTKLFYNAIYELNKFAKHGIKNQSLIMENIERTINANINEEVSRLEQQISLLATFGSVSPYIGLLGTVWGIMQSFIGLENNGQTTLQAVAPGIAEALIATFIGLFVAIPAYIFFNKFTNDIHGINSSMNKFGDELVNHLNRNLNNNIYAK